jgi:uncharacterized protein YhjY with autotransporter beta-barrel domain
MIVKFKAALAATVAVCALSSAAGAAPLSYTTPNVITTAGSTQFTFGGQTFVNQGLQGMGRIDANTKDFLGDSFGAFSGMDLDLSTWRKTANGGYTGSLYSLPDRGPNQIGQVGFSDYAARVNTFSFTFTPYTGTANLPAATSSQNQMVLTQTGGFVFRDFNGNVTTGFDPLPGTAGVVTQNGIPLPGQTSGVATGKISMDAEAIRFLNDGSFYVSDEYGATVYYFDPSGNLKGVILPPAAVLPRNAAGDLNYSSVTAGVTGRRGNQGLEGMAVTPDGKKLVTLLQSGTLQDSTGGQQNRTNTRLMIYDISSNKTPTAPIADYVMQLPIYNLQGSGAAPNATAAQSELLALNDTQFLVLSRDGLGLGLGTGNPVFKSVLFVDTAGATNIAGSAFETGTTPISPSGNLVSTIVPVQQSELVNMLNTTQLAKFGENLNNVAPTRLTLGEKWEGMALAPVLEEGAPHDFFLFVSNDNDFLSSTCTVGGLDCSQTVNSDGHVLIYRLTLPTYVDPQYLAALNAGGPAMIELAGQAAMAVGETNSGNIATQLDTSRRAGVASQGYTPWIQGAYTDDGWDNFANSGVGAKREGFRGTVGLNIPVGEGFVAGLAVGYGQQDGNTTSSISVDATGYSFGGYLQMLRGAVYANASFSVGHVDLDRISRAGAYGLTGTGRTSGTSYSASVEAGYTFDVTSNFKAVPKLGWRENNVDIKGFTETGASGGNIVVPDHSVRSSVFSLGAEVYGEMGGVKPFAHISYNWEMGKGSRDMTLRLANAQNAMGTVAMNIPTASENFVAAGGGVQGMLGQTIWNVGYTVQSGIRDRFSHVVRAGLTVPF